MNACARGVGFRFVGDEIDLRKPPVESFKSRIRTMLLPSITHFASSHETLSAAEATLAKKKAARILAVRWHLSKFARRLFFAASILALSAARLASVAL